MALLAAEFLSVGKTYWLGAFKMLIPMEDRVSRAILKISNAMAMLTCETVSKLLKPKRDATLDVNPRLGKNIYTLPMIDTRNVLITFTRNSNLLNLH